MDLAWIPGPTPSSSNALLATVSEEGTISVVDTEIFTSSSPSEKSPIQGSPGGLSSTDENYSMWNGVVLGGHPWLSSSLLLPSPLRMLLRLVLQVCFPYFAPIIIEHVT